MRSPRQTKEWTSTTLLNKHDLRQVVRLMSKQRRAEAKKTYNDIAMLVITMLRDGHKYRREATRRVREQAREKKARPRMHMVKS